MTSFVDANIYAAVRECELSLTDHEHHNFLSHLYKDGWDGRTALHIDQIKYRLALTNSLKLRTAMMNRCLISGEDTQ